MFTPLARTLQTSMAVRPLEAAWRWRYRDPSTGELVNHSELLTTAQISAIDPTAELIPGSRVLAPQFRQVAGSFR